MGFKNMKNKIYFFGLMNVSYPTINQKAHLALKLKNKILIVIMWHDGKLQKLLRQFKGKSKRQ